MRNVRLKNTGVKKRKNKENLTGEWVKLTAIFFIIVLSVKLVEFTGRAFPLKSIEMKCKTELDPGQIQSIKKMTLGASMFRIDPKNVVREISKYPKVKNVRVIRNFKEGKIEIVVDERVPFLRAVQEGTDRYVDADENGNVIGDAKDLSTVVPFVTFSSMSGEAPNKLLARAADFLKAANMESIPNSEISELDLRDPGNFILFTEDGIEFHFGEGDFAAKLKKAKKLMKQIRVWGMRVEYVDLRFGGEAIVKPKT
jgi:cell division septal protein FtsQ